MGKKTKMFFLVKLPIDMEEIEEVEE